MNVTVTGKEQKCEMLCPICRLDISDMDVNKLSLAPEPLLSQNDPTEITITPELKKVQQQMKQLFQKQLNSGGIIDIDAEDKKYLIITTAAQGNASTPSVATHNEAVARCLESTHSQTETEMTSNKIYESSAVSKSKHKHKTENQKVLKKESSNYTPSVRQQEPKETNSICSVAKDEDHKTCTTNADNTSQSSKGSRCRRNRRYKPRPS